VPDSGWSLSTELLFTQIERRLVLDAWERRPSGLSTIAIVQALGGMSVLDAGREEETVIWRYRIGTADDDDLAFEVRRTRAGPEGLRMATFGPGQLGKAGFELEDLPAREFRVECHRLVNDSQTSVVPTFLHLLNLNPEGRQFRMGVQFHGVEPHEVVRWTASYRWPGLWRSLREGGSSRGRVSMNMDDRTKVTRAAVEVVANQRAFPDLELIPSISTAKVYRSTVSEDWWLRWQQGSLPKEMMFIVESKSHQQTAT